jgi:hypothetical protein
MAHLNPIVDLRTLSLQTMISELCRVLVIRLSVKVRFPTSSWRMATVLLESAASIRS